jgi:hypothetical protein
MKNWILLIIVNLIFTANYGQTKFDDYALNLKLGAYGEFAKSENGSLCIGLDYDLLKKNNVFTIGLNTGSMINFFSEGDDYINQLYVLYGRFFDIENDLYRIQYQIGVASTHGVKRGEFLYRESGWLGTKHYKEIPFFTIGIPVKLSFKIMPSRYTSIGVDLLANFNSKKSVFMPMLSVEILGSRNKKMRKK